MILATTLVLDLDPISFGAVPASVQVTLQGQIFPQGTDQSRGSRPGGGGISVREVREVLRAATEDTSVKALVVRLDSRGGEAHASEAIWHEIRRVRSSGSRHRNLCLRITAHMLFLLPRLS